MTLFQNAYVISTRSWPCYSYHADIAPLPEGELWFYRAAVQYQAGCLRLSAGRSSFFHGAGRFRIGTDS